MKRIKFYNLPKLNKAYKKSFFKNLKKIIDKGYFINGEETKTFEKNFSQFCNARFCVGIYIECVCTRFDQNRLEIN